MELVVEGVVVVCTPSPAFYEIYPKPLVDIDDLLHYGAKGSSYGNLRGYSILSINIITSYVKRGV